MKRCRSGDRNLGIVSVTKDSKVKHKRQRKPHQKERREVVISSEKLKVSLKNGYLKWCKNVIDLSQIYVLRKRNNTYILIEVKSRDTIAIGGIRLYNELMSGSYGAE